MRRFFRLLFRRYRWARSHGATRFGAIECASFGRHEWPLLEPPPLACVRCGAQKDPS